MDRSPDARRRPRIKEAFVRGRGLFVLIAALFVLAFPTGCDPSRPAPPSRRPRGAGHAPENAEQRRRQASRAARSKGNREVAALKAEIKQLIPDVRSKALDRNDAAVMIQGYRTLRDFIELERRVHETDELAREIEELKREQWQAS